jgi:uncharacterized protein (TIGR02246 family)
MMTADEESIRALVATWHSSTAAGNVEAVLPLMADDVVFLVAGHPPMRGRGTFEKGLRELLATHRIQSEFAIEEIEVSGALAYCWTSLKVTMTPLAGGAPLNRSGSALSILHRHGDRSWVVVRDANLLAVTP